MWRECMFCEADLGRNDLVEPFPIGRRLAFDPDKGRLWVVCRRCERWNLAPIEERWEAIEACDRTFHGLRTRVSSENIGLARHREGLELVRIGAPVRGEFAAWRYGDQFGRRRKKAIVVGAGVVAVGGIVVVGGLATGAISGVVAGQFGNMINVANQARRRARLHVPGHGRVTVKQRHLSKTRLIAVAEAHEPSLLLHHSKGKTLLTGADATNAAAILMPKVNSAGGKRSVVEDAVAEIEDVGNPQAFLHTAWGTTTGKRDAVAGRSDLILKIPKATRLAVEMALHEEHERKVLAGELVQLEHAWAAAEEIAEIADGLLLPEGVEAFLEAHRDQGSTPESEAP